MVRSSSLSAALLLLLLLAPLAATHADPPADALAPPAEVDPDIPTPESVLGHPVGARAARYIPIDAYVDALVEASPLVTATTYAHSHEGRPLRYVVITSPANHERLDRIKALNARLADPRRTGDDDDDDTPDADAIIDDLPAIAWLAYAIHGDELSPADAAVQVMYRLAAGTDDRTAALRDELVMIVDPMQNPDGRDRYLAQLETLQGKVPNADYQAMQHYGLWSAGRGNHYLFDLNRDWLPQVHPETRGRSAAILEWNPHFLIDSHEMSGLDTYLFDPPREPINRHLADSVLRWREAFAADQSAAFDDYGWSYYTGEWYEEWYPGYTNAWASLLGAIGLLYEAPALNGASVRQASGELKTYADAVRANVVGTFANLETLRANRRAILRDFRDDRRWAVSAAGPLDDVFLLPPASDTARRNLLLETIERHGIEYETADAPIDARGAVDSRGRRYDRVTYPAGTVIVRSAQPHRRLMHSILGFDPRMTDGFLLEERTDLERGRGSRLYDVTGWNLAMAYGLDAAWAGDARVRRNAGAADAHASADAAGDARPDDGDAAPREVPADAAYGYVLDGASDDALRALARLHEAGAVVRVATEPFSAAGRVHDRGAMLLRRHENGDDLPAILAAAIDGLDVEVFPAQTARAEDGPDLGGRRVTLLHAPRVAIASQWPISTTSFGSTWHLLDHRLEMRCSPINVQTLGSIDLRLYNVLVLPDASGSLGAVLEGRAAERLREWVDAGGTLIAFGGAAELIAEGELDLSSVRLRRDVLDQLAVYDESVARERDARRVSVDPQSVWDGSAATAGDDDGDGDDDRDDAGANGDVEALRRADAWQRRFAPRGVFVAADVDDEHWLCYGLPARMAVLVGGSGVLMSREPVETAARLAEVDELRLAGLLWPEARGRLANSAYATREARGRGQVILFHSDPFLRGYLEGTGRMLKNAILLGPGMGTEQPLPW